jgi:hypothetical protein
MTHSIRYQVFTDIELAPVPTRVFAAPTRRLILPVVSVMIRKICAAVPSRARQIIDPTLKLLAYRSARPATTATLPTLVVQFSDSVAAVVVVNP